VFQQRTTTWLVSRDISIANEFETGSIDRVEDIGAVGHYFIKGTTRAALAPVIEDL
jgi:hypothetical protein